MILFKQSFITYLFQFLHQYRFPYGVLPVVNFTKFRTYQQLIRVSNNRSKGAASERFFYKSMLPLRYVFWVYTVVSVRWIDILDSSVARGGAMGHLHPPQVKTAKHQIEFQPFIYKISILTRLLSKNSPTAPPSQISGYATNFRYVSFQ